MTPTPKLTKKQRKGLAFRQKNLGQSKDLPEEDSPQLFDEETVHNPTSGSIGKRKREKDELVHDTDSKKAKITAPPSQSSTGNRSSRYILFVGNLRYTTTKECIEDHFSKCDPPPSVRLVAPKGSQKSKGCAFVEFTHPNALQQGLKLHHSTLEGRKLNVELTVGGGGKGVDRLNRLRERNKSLNDQRNKQRSRSTGVIGDTSKGQTAPSRLSLTSGMDTAPENKKTWSADDIKLKRKRGDRRHAPKHISQRASLPCTLTGANAVVVG